MNKDTIIIDDETTNRVATELSREIANAIEESIQLADQGRVGEAQAVINKLCSDIRYKPMVGVIPNGNVKLTEHPVIQHYANEIANASRFGEANFSIPLNGRGPWTPALKGKLDINDLIREVHGLRIIIENAKGSLRCGYTKDGKRWEVRMPADYGYVSAVDVGGFAPAQTGADGDGVDCWLGEVPSEQVHIIDQRDLDTKKFDEHKCFVDFASRQAAIDTYVKAYHDGRGQERIMGVRTLSIPQFKEWLQTAKTKKRASRKNFVNEGEGHLFHGNQWTKVREAVVKAKETGHHFSVYNDKAVSMDYVSDKKKQFNFAAMRIVDNGHNGHVVTPQGKVFEVLKGKRSARPVEIEGANEETGHPFHGNQWTKLAKDPNNDPAGHPTGKLKHAVLVIGGKRYRGPSHFQAYLEFSKSPEGEGASEVRVQHEGFETDSGHFLNRGQAARYVGHHQTSLTSEEASAEYDLPTIVANGQLYTQDALMANEELTEEQQRHDKLRSHLEKIYRQELEDAVFQSEQEMLAKPDDQHHLELALLALLFLLRDGLKAAGQKSYAIAAKTLLPGSLQSGLPSSRRGFDVGEAAKSYAQERAPKLENAVNKVKSKVYNSIQRGVAGGESKQALARRIREGFEQAQPEIYLIAETEPQVVYGIAQHEALKLAGFERKKWITQNDERVRHSHTLCEAQEAIGVDQSFHNGLKFPGDPNGPASEVINCRCYLLGVK